MEPTLTQWPAAGAPGQAGQPYTPPPPVQAPPPPVTPPAQPKTPRRRTRSLFWPGFALGFLLLSALSCGLSAAALGLNRLSLDDFRGSTGAAWTPMPITPAAVVADPAPDAAETPAAAGSTRFTPGQTVTNLTGSRVNIRLTPGYLSKAAGDVIGQLDAGQTLQVLGDPTPTDDLIWWRVQATSNGQTVVGWVAEATASGVQILGASR